MPELHCLDCHFLILEKEIRPEMRTNIGVSQERQTKKTTLDADIRENIKNQDWDFFTESYFRVSEIGCFQKVWENGSPPSEIKEIIEFTTHFYIKVALDDRKKCPFFQPVNYKIGVEAAEKERKERKELKKITWQKLAWFSTIIAAIVGIVMLLFTIF